MTEEKPIMSSELHRNQVTDAQTIQENLRDAAYHEAGHVVVARFLGLTVRKVEMKKMEVVEPMLVLSSTYR